MLSKLFSFFGILLRIFQGYLVLLESVCEINLFFLQEDEA